MTGIQAALIRAHEANIRRYARLLHTQLTPLERDYVRRRLDEERREVKRVKSEAMSNADALLMEPSNVAAARAEEAGL